MIYVVLSSNCIDFYVDVISDASVDKVHLATSYECDARRSDGPTAVLLSRSAISLHNNVR